MDETQLIERWIEPNLYRPGADEVRLAGHGVSVWALIGDFSDSEYAVESEIPEVAADFGVPEEAVRAALAYYRRYRSIIDNRLAANMAES